ncbi:cytochrome bc complex cytochrome b subunit [Gemmatimonadota bacterium]
MSDSGQEPRKNRVLRWLEEATDARILGIPRLFGLLYGPLDDRLSLGEAWRAAMRRKIPSFVGWKHAFGGATYFLCMILVATGVMLSFYYRPSSAEAYQSLQYLETEVTFGWLVRHAHFWAASLVVLTALVHLFRVLFTGTYRKPRETTWLMGILLLITLFLFMTSGYLLPWDQFAYWTTTAGLDHMEAIPVFGGLLASLLRADEFVSGATLSRFYATHVILLPWVLLLFLSLHFQLIRKHGVAPVDAVDQGEGEPFYPNHMLRQLVVVFLVVAAVVTLAAFWPRPFGSPADPFLVPEGIPSLGIGGAILVGAARLPGHLGLFGLPILILALAVLPLVEKSRVRTFRGRPLTQVVFALFALLLLASLIAGIGGGSGTSAGVH